MKINTLFSVFTPKDAKFIPLLKELSEVMVQASIVIEEVFATADEEKRKELCHVIKVEEVKGDKISNRIFKALNETFITPFDREDIHELAETMDDVIDAINRTAQKVLMYTPTHLPETTVRLSGVVKKAAKTLQQAVEGLSNIKKNGKDISMYCKEVKCFEEEADMVYEEAIVSIFHDEMSPLEVLKLKEIIQDMEKSVDKMDTSGKVIKTILVKYS